jgi:predicted Zn-dependent peptidase
VILEERHDTPRVAVEVDYHVGRRDQPEGYSGLAHLTEHLMFCWARAPTATQCSF